MPAPATSKRRVTIPLVARAKATIYQYCLFNSFAITAESARIGTIVLVEFLLAHLFALLVDGFAIELLYAIESTLLAVVRYTTLLTALLYTLSRAVTARHR